MLWLIIFFYFFIHFIFKFWPTTLFFLTPFFGWITKKIYNQYIIWDMCLLCQPPMFGFGRRKPCLGNYSLTYMSLWNLIFWKKFPAKLDGEALSITDPPPTRSTTWSYYKNIYTNIYICVGKRLSEFLLGTYINNW